MSEVNQILAKLVLHNLKRKQANGEKLSKMEKDILAANKKQTNG